jgi:hypothetical protein
MTIFVSSLSLLQSYLFPSIRNSQNLQDIIISSPKKKKETIVQPPPTPTPNTAVSEQERAEAKVMTGGAMHRNGAEVAVTRPGRLGDSPKENVPRAGTRLVLRNQRQGE